MLPGEEATGRKTKALHSQPQLSPQPASVQPRAQPSRTQQRCLHAGQGWQMPGAAPEPGQPTSPQMAVAAPFKPLGVGVACYVEMDTQSKAAPSPWQLCVLGLVT